MKVKFALVPSDRIDEVQDITARLDRAVESGEVSLSDSLTGELFMLADSNHAVSMPEDEWKRFLKEVRNFHPGFESNYVIDRRWLEHIKLSGANILSEGFNCIVARALEIGGVVIQVPFEES